MENGTSFPLWLRAKNSGLVFNRATRTSGGGRGGQQSEGLRKTAGLPAL